MKDAWDAEDGARLVDPSETSPFRGRRRQARRPVLPLDTPAATASARH
jgi:hypothetical protein